MGKLYPTLLVLLVVSFSSCQPKPNPTTTSNTSSASSPSADTRPMLAAEVKSVSLYPVPGQPQNLALSLVVSVGNAALPSMAKEWKLEVNSSNRTENLDPVRVNGVVELPGTKRSVDLAIDDLALRTAESPITKTPVDGVLTFVIPQTSERELITKKTSLRLHFKDAVGNSYQTERVVVGQKVADK